MTDINIDQLTLGDELGDGGQGRVIAVQSRPDQVLKLYHHAQSAHFRPDALSVHITRARGLDFGGRHVFEVAAWPTARVTEAGRVVGFLMPRVPADFEIVIGGRRRLADLSYLAATPAPMWGPVQLPSQAARVEILRALAGVMARLHKGGLVMGDISFGNVLWAADPARVFLLDCDGIFPERGSSIMPQADTLDWDDPRATPSTPPDRDRDAYKLALAVLRILSRDLAARPHPQGEYEFGLAGPRQPAVERLLRRAAGPVGNRPTAQEWFDALGGRGRRPVALQPGPTRPQPTPGVAVRPRGPRRRRPVA